MKKNKIKLVLNPNNSESRTKIVEKKNEIHPPKNNITVNKLINIIDPYSAKKIAQSPYLNIQR